MRSRRGDVGEGRIVRMGEDRQKNCGRVNMGESREVESDKGKRVTRRGRDNEGRGEVI